MPKLSELLWHLTPVETIPISAVPDPQSIRIGIEKLDGCLVHFWYVLTGIKFLISFHLFYTIQ